MSAAPAPQTARALLFEQITVQIAQCRKKNGIADSDAKKLKDLRCNLAVAVLNQ
jgi:hypothetical protein